VSSKRTMLDKGGWVFKKSVFARTSLMDDPLVEFETQTSVGLSLEGQASEANLIIGSGSLSARSTEECEVQ